MHRLARAGAEESAEGPEEGQSRLGLLFDVVGRLRAADVTAIAAETAYFAILTTPPFLVALVSAIALLSQWSDLSMVEELRRTIARVTPGETGALLNPLIEDAVERTDEGLSLFGFFGSAIVAVWSGSRAIQALTRGFDRVYGVTVAHTPIIQRLIAIFLAITVGLFFSFSFTVFLFGGTIARWAAANLGRGEEFAAVWTVISWPITTFVILVALGVLYSWGPNVELPFQWFSTGAVVAAVGWTVMVLAFRVYVWIVDIGNLYGVLGSFMLLLLVSFVTAVILQVGAAVNASLSGWSSQQSEAKEAEN